MSMATNPTVLERIGSARNAFANLEHWLYSLNSGAKILTTSVLRLQELAINSLKDGLLFLTEGNDAGDLETALSVS